MISERCFTEKLAAWPSDLLDQSGLLHSVGTCTPCFFFFCFFKCQSLSTRFSVECALTIPAHCFWDPMPPSGPFHQHMTWNLMFSVSVFWAVIFVELSQFISLFLIIFKSLVSLLLVESVACQVRVLCYNAHFRVSFKPVTLKEICNHLTSAVLSCVCVCL